MSAAVISDPVDDSTRPLPHPAWRQQPGLLRRIFADPQPVLDELSAAYGPVVGLGAGPVRMAIGDAGCRRRSARTSSMHSSAAT